MSNYQARTEPVLCTPENQEKKGCSLSMNESLAAPEINAAFIDSLARGLCSGNRALQPINFHVSSSTFLFCLI
jgi:hypothetical protein